jgi:hypothetical protein
MVEFSAINLCSPLEKFHHALRLFCCRYYELDKSLGLVDSLKQKMVIEFPTLHIVPESQAHKFATLSKGRKFATLSQGRTFVFRRTYFLDTCTVKSVLSGHPGDQKLVAL